MRYFAEIDSNNIVLRVLVLDDATGIEWLNDNLGGEWIDTSYTGAIRKNYAGIGMTYDSELDAFIPPQPFDSWVLNEETAQWEAPAEYPTDGKDYSWNEETTSWDEVPSTDD